MNTDCCVRGEEKCQYATVRTFQAVPLSRRKRSANSLLPNYIQKWYNHEVPSMKIFTGTFDLPLPKLPDTYTAMSVVSFLGCFKTNSLSGTCFYLSSHSTN